MKVEESDPVKIAPPNKSPKKKAKEDKGKSIDIGEFTHTPIKALQLLDGELLQIMGLEEVSHVWTFGPSLGPSLGLGPNVILLE
ncbi:hypothetical protein PIB30_088418 [Stylosanthes scabra]|uniref:Uncharacterized protein n=1 Tax=Stylosanthes scabra TaxID=79078 RepID=A0ABU6RU29_9FABA|nr:hypothetical protein [Stylosanthes scabra]